MGILTMSLFIWLAIRHSMTEPIVRIWLENNLWASLVTQWLRLRCQCRRHRFDPWSQKITPAMEQRSPCATTIEPVP